MNVKIKVPTSLSDIKLSQYQKFIKLTKDVEDNAYISRQLVAVFCNLTDKLVLQMAKKDFNPLKEAPTKLAFLKAVTSIPKFLVAFKELAIVSLFCLSSIVRNTLPSLSMVTNTKSLLGATLEDTELGVSTAIASEGLNFVVKIKKDNKRKATSHMAVMSILVLLRGNLALPIV